MKTSSGSKPFVETECPYDDCGYGAPSAVKQSTAKSRAFAAARELAAVCKAERQQRQSNGWRIYRLDVCPITGASYPDPDNILII